MGGLLSRIVSEAPHLEAGVHELRRRQEKVAGEVDALRQQLADLTRTVDVVSIRAEVARLTAEIRELRARESDLAYGAYSVDLGVGD